MINEPAEEEYLNVLGVENYLLDRGAFHFDGDVVQMLVAPQDLKSTSDEFESGFVIDTDDAQTLRGQTVNGVPHPSFAPSSHPATAAAGHTSQFELVTLNTQKLLHKMSEKALCLGTGPGYHPTHIDQAIAASRIS